MTQSLFKSTKMIKTTIIIFTLIFSKTVLAEWTRIGGGDNFDHYIDIATKRKVGNKVKIWELMDFKTSKKIDLGNYLSEASQMEYECANETFRLLAVVGYTENMQGGSILYNFIYQPGEISINPITPNSVGETAFKLACRKK